MIIISEAKIDIGAALDGFAKANHEAGAVTSFTGQVRSEENQVSKLYLEAYPGVTQAGIEEALQDARKRWPLSGALVMHRTGTMSVGETIVFIATAAKHRRAAFEACDFLMDYLKTKAIFWKKQTTAAGSTWVEPRDEDYSDQKRWE